MDKTKWKENFKDKISDLSTIKDSINEFLEIALTLIDFNEIDINYDDMKDYVFGYKKNKKKYNLLGEKLLRDYFKFGNKISNKDEILLKCKSKLIELLFSNCYYLFQCDESYVEEIMKQILSFTTKTIKYNYIQNNWFTKDTDEWVVQAKAKITSDNEIEESRINYKNIISVCNPRFMMKFEQSESEDIDLSGLIDTLKFESVNSSEPKYMYMYFIYGSNEEIDWYYLIDNSYLECDVTYCDTMYSWEEYILESFNLYNTKKYELAFLEIFIGFDSFVENTISILKDLISKELYKVCFDNEEDLKYLINNIYSDDISGKKDDLRYLLTKYKRLCNDSRNLIKEKFSDIIDLNSYIYTNNKKSSFCDNDGKYYKIREKLKKFAINRNDLAHGNQLQEEIDFKSNYLLLLSIIFELLLDFKQFNFTELF